MYKVQVSLQTVLLYRKFRTMLRYCLISLILLLSACAAPSRSPDISVHRPDAGGRMNDVAFYALSLADTPYRYGGDTGSSGFDCSGFVQHVYLNTLGIRLPRTSREMSRIGEHASSLRPGDLVFFNTSRQPYSHVGIYLGDERFVHSPSSGKSIMVTSMRESYWRDRYNGARRVSP